jgi:hypothetical protein
VAGLGKLLLTAGAVLAALGLLLTMADRLPLPGALGRLPGDIRIVRPGFRFYLPLTTSLLVSVVLTLLVQGVRIFLRR